MKSRIVSFICGTTSCVIVTYLFVVQCIGTAQSINGDTTDVMPYSLFNILSLPLLLLASLAICVITFEYCPKRLLPKRKIFFWTARILALLTLLCMSFFFVYAVQVNYSTFNDVTAENIIDVNGILPAVVARIKNNIVWCWVNFGLSIFGFITVLFVILLRIKD